MNRAAAVILVRSQPQMINKEGKSGQGEMFRQNETDAKAWPGATGYLICHDHILPPQPRTGGDFNFYYAIKLRERGRQKLSAIRHYFHKLRHDDRLFVWADAPAAGCLDAGAGPPLS